MMRAPSYARSYEVGFCPNKDWYGEECPYLKEYYNHDAFLNGRQAHEYELARRIKMGL